MVNIDCDKVNGLKTVEKILSFLNISGDQTPVVIIALTNDKNKEVQYKHDYLNSGFTGFLVKPVSRFELKIVGQSI